jgi:zinc/manganese transport system substrate-binding protein
MPTLLLTLLLPLLAACSTASASPTVVATTSVLGGIAAPIVSCAGGTLDVLMPAGADPHDFAPSSRQLAEVEDADLVIANGLGLEAGLADALAAATADGAHILEIGPAVDPLPLPGSTDAAAHPDPHIWFDMSRMASAAELIGSTLADRTGNDAYRSCGSEQAAQIRAADTRVRATLESVPEAQRVLVTDHDAFGYLAKAYGYRVAGSVVSSATTMAEPSSADLAALADLLRTEGITTIFSNVAEPTSLSAAVAAEVGPGVQVVPLYVESLGAPGTGASTYIGMMEADATAIASGLGGGH